MNNRYSDIGSAGRQWAAGHVEAAAPPTGGRAEGDRPSPFTLRCGTLVLTGFPVPLPKGTVERPVHAPAHPARAAGGLAASL